MEPFLRIIIPGILVLLMVGSVNGADPGVPPLPQSIRALTDPKIVALINWYDRETLQFERAEIHEAIATRLLELGMNSQIKALVQLTDSSSLTALNEKLILAKALGNSRDEKSEQDAMGLLEQIISVEPMAVVKASWEGDRGKAIIDHNHRRLAPDSAKELAKQMDDASFAQFAENIKYDFVRTQAQSAWQLVALSDKLYGPEGVLRLSKTYQDHPVAGKIFQEWLLRDVNGSR